MKKINEIKFKATARELFTKFLKQYFKEEYRDNMELNKEEAKNFLTYACHRSKGKFPLISRRQDPREDIFSEDREKFNLDYFVNNTIQIWCNDHIEVIPGSVSQVPN